MREPLTENHGEGTKLSAVVHRSSGARQTASIIRLWYDGCEIASREHFEPGELIEIELGIMGKIRARVAGSADGVLSVRFDQECPV
jgi:hypothetical protein